MLSAFLIIAGALADRYGRRRIFIIGLVSFGLTSALCGLAPTMEWLVIFRLLQGAAGALLVPGPLSLITANFEGQARARAFGLWSAATAALTITGPLIGGIIVDSFSWRLAFLVNVPLVLLALYAAVRYVPESLDPDAPRRLDWLGSAVIAIAVGGISFGLIRGQEEQWSDPARIHRARHRHRGGDRVPHPHGPTARPAGTARPVPHPGLRGHQRVDVPHLRRAVHLLVPGERLPPGRPGLHRARVGGRRPAGGHPADAVLDPCRHASSGRIGAYRFLVIGPAAHGRWAWPGSRASPATSTPWLLDLGSGVVVPPTDVFLDVLPAVILFGVGITLVVAPLTTTLMGSVPVANAGLGSAINNAISRVGSPLLLALLYLVITAVVLRLAEPVGADAGHRFTGGPGRRPATQPAAAGHRPADGRGHRPGVDRCLPI